MLINDLVKKTNLSKDTIRYYEKIGLIPKAARLSNGYRSYTNTTIKQLKFIKMAQTVGFTLNQIKPALPYIANPKPNCPFLQEALNKQLKTIDERIKALKLAKSNLISWKVKNQSLITSVKL